MNSHSASNPPSQLGHILSALIKHKQLWLIPMLLGALLSCVYAFALRAETWSAKQSLIVRDDLLGQSYKPGQFESLDSMKSAQETIFEIARKPQVIRNALRKIGPSSRGFLGLGGKGYPSEEVIEQVQGDISFSAPNGAEFGATEVIILNTKNSTRERAKEFTQVLVSEIILKVNEVRHRKFQSMEAEILQTCDVARSALEESKDKLREMDQELGQDSGSMVAMGESSFRDDPLVREIAQLNLERRGVQSEVEKSQGMLKSLEAAKRDPEAIINISSDLTSRQPALDALKREMVQQKGAYALLSGRYTIEHPAVASARQGIIVMQKEIRLELDNAASDTRAQLEIKAGKLARLDKALEALKSRLLALGEKRADSITLFADIKKRTEVLNNARTNLAEIHGLASSKNTDLLTTVDEVQVSTRADGMGKQALILCGTFGGLMLGMGLVMLIAPPPTTPSQTQSLSTPVYQTQAPATQAPATQAPVAPAPVTQAPAPQAPIAQPSAVEEPAARATANAGVAMAKTGLAASTNVLRDLMGSVKRKPGSLSAEEIAKELESQKKIDARLNSVKAKKNVEPDPPKAQTQSPATQSPAAQGPVTDAKPDEKTKLGVGAKIVPAASNPFKTKSAPAVGSGTLGEAPVTQKSATRLGSTEVEIPDMNPGPQSQGTGLSKLVDKAFEDELKSTTRTESQTIQLATLSKVIGGTSALGAAATGLATLAKDSVAQTVTDSAKKTAAEITPRSANIRPVDLARQAQSDDFDRVGLEEVPGQSKGDIESSKKESWAAAGDRGSANPFLKDRPAKVSKPKPAVPSEERSVVPVPDQIRKLSDSIASFARPVKGGSK